jgi:hypothetical protein
MTMQIDLGMCPGRHARANAVDWAARRRAL